MKSQFWDFGGNFNFLSVFRLISATKLSVGYILIFA